MKKFYEVYKKLIKQQIDMDQSQNQLQNWTKPQENVQQSASNQYWDIQVVFQDFSLLVIKRWKTFKQPMWVDGLKKAIQEFKNKVQFIFIDTLKMNPQLIRKYKDDSGYQWEWNDQMLYSQVPYQFLGIRRRSQIQRKLKELGIKISPSV